MSNFHPLEVMDRAFNNKVAVTPFHIQEDDICSNALDATVEQTFFFVKLVLNTWYIIS